MVRKSSAKSAVRHTKFAPVKPQRREKPAPAARIVSLPEQSHGRPHPERRALGRALRDRSPRRGLSKWKAAPGRADPVALLIESSRGRLPDLVLVRYGRLMASPFAFFRGAASIMAPDLSFLPTTGMNVVACGDAHLVNFGGYATPERRLVFDINDFDEVSIAP